MEILYSYKNGNFKTTIWEDGTKERETIDPNATKFVADFPENIDICLTKKCDIGCQFCYENATPNGKQASLFKTVKGKTTFYHNFFNTLQPGTEVALGGGSITSIPKEDFITFLNLLKKKKLIPNITINQNELEENKEYIQNLIDQKLVYGVGISFVFASDVLLQFCKKNSNTVIHVINGVVTKECMEYLADNNLKVLILGFKDFGRGANFQERFLENIKENQFYLYNSLASLVERFAVLSFDNLAIQQLDVKRILSEEEWREFYMGDDGQFTMFIDLVEEKFAKNSIVPKAVRLPLKKSISEMFKSVKNS